MRVTLLLVVGVLLVGCASTPSGVRRDMDVLTNEEIQESNHENAYDIIRSMRPRWLRARGPTSFTHENPITVYVDGTRMGGIEELSAIHRSSIERMRYYSPTEAQARWGLNNTNGAIEVTTRSW